MNDDFIKLSNCILAFELAPSKSFPSPLFTLIVYAWVICPMILPTLSFALMSNGNSAHSITLSGAWKSIVSIGPGRIFITDFLMIHVSSVHGHNSIFKDVLPAFGLVSLISNAESSVYGL
jgi:hypothetical protein